LKINMNLLFHLSKEDLDGKTLEPRVPNNYFTQECKEDNITPRISFSPFVEGCLQSLVARDGDVFNIYINVSPVEAYIPTMEEVPDQCLTGEVWAKTPTKLRYYGKVTVGKRVETAPSKGYYRGDDYVEVLLHNYIVEAFPNRKNGILVDYKFED